jgi:hypothetical protein
MPIVAENEMRSLVLTLMVLEATGGPVALKIFAHPDPALSSQPPWYTIPGFILSIPALPLIMPSLLGVVLLRRAGDEGQ